MISETLSKPALDVIDNYIHFKLGSAVCSVPYFNNKTVRARGSLPVHVGKGSSAEIYDEVKSIAFKMHLDIDQLPDESLKKLLTDSNLGIDCSGFAYYILDSESQSRGTGHLNRQLNFIHTRGIIGRFVKMMHPTKNVDVETLADDSNSRVVSLSDIRPGDMITMLGNDSASERNHILVVHGIDRSDTNPTHVYYSHAASDPEDGVYGTGIKQGSIEIPAAATSIMECIWSENGSLAIAERTFIRAQKSHTEIRRLNWF